MALCVPMLLNAQVFDSSTKATTAQTNYGKVAGYIERGVYTYKGIPFAKAERFQPAVRPDAWEGIRSSRHWGPVCPQPKNNGWRNDQTAFFYQWNDGFADEDCLRLNIWTKADVPLSVKQTVHLVPGQYKVTFNLDANDGVDTKVQLKVGNLTAYTLPKGQGWEKWTPCATDVFTVTEEGDYEIAFVGNVPAETWLALDNVKIVTADGNSLPSNTGAAESSAAAAALLAAASLGIALSKKNKK